MTPQDVVAALNAQRGLQLRAASDAARLVTLRVAVRRVDGFEALRNEVRWLPGTARTVAVVTDEIGAFSAVAVFRESYAAPSRLIGRSRAGAALRDVLPQALRSALALDPQ